MKKTRSGQSGSLVFIRGSEEASLITLHLSRDLKEVCGRLRTNIPTEGKSGAKALGQEGAAVREAQDEARVRPERTWGRRVAGGV